MRAEVQGGRVERCKGASWYGRLAVWEGKHVGGMVWALGGMRCAVGGWRYAMDGGRLVVCDGRWAAGGMGGKQSGGCASGRVCGRV